MTAVWFDDVSSNVFAATKPFGMSWQLPAQIVIGGTLPAFPNPSLSVNPAGDAITVTLNGSGLISASKPPGLAIP